MGKIVFVACAAAVVAGILSPPLALAIGIAFGMMFVHPFEKASHRWARTLLQVSVVALGFGTNIGEIVHAGRASLPYTAIGITLTMALGILIGKLCRVRPKTAFLITAGTAICGGSAIAAIAPITEPNEEELAMSLGTVFTLNSVALFLFPLIGATLHLTQNQFGLWAALAIHDTSSVVGAAAKFGPQALAVGTIVKLTRALWIVPVALITAFAGKRRAKVRFPWFIVLFCLAALATGIYPHLSEFTKAGRTGLALTLFLIGTGISRRTIRQAGGRVMIQGLLLWIAVATMSLAAICLGWIHLS